MKRLVDWEVRLAEFFLARIDVPFAWGSNDCATFAIAAVEAMTGQRIELAGYATEHEADALIEQHGGVSAGLSAVFGDPIPVHSLQRGDVAVVMQGDAEMITVYNTPYLASPGPRGLMMRRAFAPSGEPVAVRAWKVAR